MREVNRAQRTTHSNALETRHAGSNEASVLETESEIAAALTSIREMLQAIEEENVEILTAPRRDSTSKVTIVRLHPPSTEQLDKVYAALTKASDSYPATSPLATVFDRAAVALIREFKTYEKPGRLLIRKDSSAQSSLSSIEFDDPESSITVGEDGNVELSSNGVSFTSLTDWKQPGSPSRQRYEHLFDEK